MIVPAQMLSRIHSSITGQPPPKTKTTATTSSSPPRHHHQLSNYNSNSNSNDKIERQLTFNAQSTTEVISGRHDQKKKTVTTGSANSDI